MPEPHGFRADSENAAAAPGKAAASPARNGSEHPRVRGDARPLESQLDLGAMGAIVEGVCGRYRIRDWQEDLLQSLATAYWESLVEGRTSPGDLEAMAHHLARAELARRRRQSTVLRKAVEAGGVRRLRSRTERRRGGRTAPPLCPRLGAAMGGAGLSDRELASLLMAAALRVIRRGALLRGKKGRTWAFLQAYVEKRPVEAIAQDLGMTPHAVVELLRRLSRTIRNELMKSLDLPDVVASRIREGKAIDPDWSARLKRGLEVLTRPETGPDAPCWGVRGSKDS